MKQKRQKIKIQKAVRKVEVIHRQFIKKTLDLAVSGFGLVAALAWNEVIKETVNTYIKPFFGRGSGLISLVIYALIVTFLAVLITYNLSKLAEKR